MDYERVKTIKSVYKNDNLMQLYCNKMRYFFKLNQI